MRLTKKNFTTPAVTIGTMHYFPSADDINNIVDEKVSMAVSYYSQSRRKWLSDTAYLAVVQAKDIINYARKRGVLIGQSSVAL
ncbi:hypothetical protein [Thalassotalea piscium]|uniref:Uncharacterized protein n=1 Tax=Thalassotalea piscium TaxID=1230533 RepID=A0A7X0NJX7_9GAMM|nr:hypothetical protein [Thalassotalea piscium]MBB6544804.1 hypothetical protein [Thalassotalea piscium]